MRFFIALEVPDESKQELLDIQQKLKNLIPQARLTDNNKLHLTIAFVGEEPDELKDKLVEVMQKAALDIPSFEVTPAFLDGFPNLHHPNIIFVGIKGDIDKLHILRERVKDELSSIGIPADERRFIPHIAIAKLKNFRVGKDVEAKLQDMTRGEFKPIRVSSIKLFESIPNHGFHQHNTLAEIKLTN